MKLSQIEQAPELENLLVLLTPAEAEVINGGRRGRRPRNVNPDGPGHT